MTRAPGYLRVLSKVLEVSLAGWSSFFPPGKWLLNGTSGLFFASLLFGFDLLGGFNYKSLLNQGAKGVGDEELP